MPRYVPRRGDFVSITFDPQAGHEQKGRCPALILSHDIFNRHTGLAITCPVTNTNRGVPFHLPVPAGLSLTGLVMVDQVKSVDYIARRAKFIAKAPTAFLDDVLALLDACIK
ncbi:MAG TPA: type II toxin-antitoxin system PemK/MazF family toxin [Pirellulales bacterium]|nr:type II toxin-antitoxin system PemK/MazF family toxin [Pirellulales bacterium]